MSSLHKDPNRIGAGILSALMLISAAICTAAMIVSRQKGAHNMMVSFALLSFTLFFGALLSAGYKVFRAVEDRRIHAAPRLAHLGNTYVAEYSIQSRAISLALVMFFAALTIFMTPLHSVSASVLSVFAIIFAWHAVRVNVTRVEFGSNLISARLPWFKNISEPYENILRLDCNATTVNVQFSSGQVLTLDSQLGDPEVILEHLRAHADGISWRSR